MHFAAVNPITIDTKVTTNDDKSTLYLIIDSSIALLNLTPSPKHCFQIGDYFVVKELIPWKDHSGNMIQSGLQYDVILY